MRTYLKLPGQTVEVDVGPVGSKAGHGGLRFQSKDRAIQVYLLGESARDFAETLRRLADRLDSSTGAGVPQRRVAPAATNLDWLTPRYVIDYFKNSPVLCEMADEVEQVLGPLVQALPEPERSQLERDLEQVEPYLDQILDEQGQLVYGGQSRIAEALGVNNAGSYRERILAVAQALVEQKAA